MGPSAGKSECPNVEGKGGSGVRVGDEMDTVRGDKAPHC